MIRSALAHPIRRAIYAAAAVCARLRPPDRLDQACVAAAVLAIRAYRLTLSPLVGRDCFFRTTCSRFAEERLLETGWSQGWRDAFDRLSDCGGEHRIVTLIDGRRRLKSASGRCYEDHDLADPGAGGPAPPPPSHTRARLQDP